MAKGDLQCTRYKNKVCDKNEKKDAHFGHMGQYWPFYGHYKYLSM